MTATSLWCSSAWLPAGPVDRVRLVIEDGRLSGVHAGVDPSPGDHVLRGLVMPGFANCHSHTFHRVLRGSGVPGGTFWSWRTDMYRVAGRLTPESYHDLAVGAYAEMVEAGYTSVGEFHYVHHRPDGTPYPDPNAMGEALISAARDVGIRLTLLDCCYLSSGFGQPLSPEQTRFGDTDVHAWRKRVDALADAHRADPDVRIGAAIHSVRALEPRDMQVVASWAHEHDAPLHVHLSEQVAENSACLDARGATPTRVLQDAGAWRGHATAVHATHLEDQDIQILGSHQVTCCLCPSTEADLADGIGPALDLARAGAALSLGSDQNVLCDPLEEMRRLEMDQRLARGTRENFTPVALVNALTTTGQESLGWAGPGGLVEGASADLVHLDTSSAALAGARVDRIPLLAAARDVADVWVSGRRVVEGGHHRDVEVAAELARSIASLRSAS